MKRVGGFEFQSSEDVKIHVRNILSRYEIGDEVTEPNDRDFLINLISDSDEPNGIDKIRLVRNPRQKATDLEIETVAGEVNRVAWYTLC